MTSCHIPQSQVPWQVSMAGPDAASSVLCLGTTAPALESLGNPEWMADMEYVWRTRTADVRKSLEARAKRRRKLAHSLPDDVPFYRVACLRSAEWADEHARALAMARADVLSTCDRRWRSVACGCNRFEIRVGCDQPSLCASCRKRHSVKWRRRITKGMDIALRRERETWRRTPAHRRRGMLPGIYLITLTAPHTGDLEADRDAMGPAVRKLLKHATKNHWWDTYALTWEATGGAKGDGHMHVHLAVISGWIPYTSADERYLTRGDVPCEALRAMEHRSLGEDLPSTWRLNMRRPARGLREVWRDAMPGALVLDVQAPRKGSDDAATAGGYLAKYVTKGVDPGEFTGRKAGELLCAFRGRRKVSTSAHFWSVDEAKCECCGTRYRSLGAPCSLQTLAPGAVLRSLAERAGWWIPRGAVQVGLRWEGG